MNLESSGERKESPLNALAVAIHNAKKQFTSEGNKDYEFSNMDTIIPRVQRNEITPEQGFKELKDILDSRIIR